MERIERKHKQPEERAGFSLSDAALWPEQGQAWPISATSTRTTWGFFCQRWWTSWRQLTGASCTRRLRTQNCSACPASAKRPPRRYPCLGRLSSSSTWCATMQGWRAMKRPGTKCQKQRSLRSLRSTRSFTRVFLPGPFIASVEDWMAAQPWHGHWLCNLFFFYDLPFPSFFSGTL